MRWDSLETSFFELVSILSFLNKKKKFFFLLDSNWRNFGSFLFVQWLAEMFEPTFGLGGAIFLSLMGPLEIFQKKKKSSKKKLFKFLSFGFKLEKFWFFPFRTMARKCLSQRSDWEGLFPSL